MRVLRADDDGVGACESAEGGGCGETHHSRAHHRYGPAVWHVRFQRGMYAGRDRLDDDRGGIVEVIVDEVQHRVVGDEALGPSSACRRARPELETGLELARIQVGVVIRIGRRLAVLDVEAPCCSTENWFDDDSTTVVEFSDDLMAHDERE